MDGALFGLPVALLMLGVPLWHNISQSRRGGRLPSHPRVFKWWLRCGLIVLFSLSCGLVFGIIGFVLSNLPSLSSASKITTDCIILSSGVDLRSTKICTPQVILKALGNAHMETRFRCYFEYYWASVFKVAFKPNFLEETVQATAEVPREALPNHCRPGFGLVWKVTERHQVNGTYPCKYTPGSFGTVEIANDLFSHCKSADRSVFELLKQACTLLFFSDQWIFSTANQSGIVFRRALSSIFVAASYSVIVTGITKVASMLRTKLFVCSHTSTNDVVHFEVQFIITCMLITSLLVGAWYCGHLEGLILYMN